MNCSIGLRVRSTRRSIGSRGNASRNRDAAQRHGAAGVPDVTKISSWNERSIHHCRAMRRLGRDMDLTATEDSTPPARAPAPRLTRRRFLTAGAATLGFSGTATGAYAGAIEPFGLVVTRYAPAPPAWPAGPQAIDHGDCRPACRRSRHDAAAHPARGRHRAGFAIRPHRAARRLRGVVSDSRSNRSPTPRWSAELARLKAPLGVWAILGNHDWWHDLAGVRTALASAQIPVLENDAVLLGTAGQRFWLAGIGDQARAPARLRPFPWRG